MTITQIRYFVQVAENMNFTKAARQLYVAQQVVSKQVKRLEEELGFLLFERTAQGITLSAGGQKMYQYWKKMLIEQQEQISLAKSKMQETEKEIHIGILPIGLLQDRIAAAINALGKENQGWKFGVENLSYRELGQKMLRGELDCILSLEDENKEILTDDFAEIPLMELMPSLVISDIHLLYHEKVKPKELKDTTFYISSQKYSYRAEDNILKYCKSTGFVPEKIQYFDDVNSMELALYGGTGVALIYYEFFRNSSGHLKKIPLEPEAYVVGNRFMVAYPQNRYLQLKGFLKYLLEDTKG